MVLLRTSCTGASSNTIFPKKTELPSEKKLTPRPPPEKSRTP